MAYNSKLRPKKFLLQLEFTGRIGKFDFMDEPIKWGDMTDEMLIEFVNTASPKSIADHLTGELPKVKAKKLSPKPVIDESKEPKK